MANSEQIRPLLASSAGVAAGTFPHRSGIVLPATTEVLPATSARSDHPLGAEVRQQIFSNPNPLMRAGEILAALVALSGLPTIPFLPRDPGKEYLGWRGDQKALSGGKTSPAVPSVPIRNNPEMVVKLGPLAVGVGLQQRGAAAA
jgi:hypothetical protein